MVGKGRIVRDQVPRLTVVEEPGATAATLGVEVATISRVLMPVRREFSGREVYTRYHWSVPLVKLFLPVAAAFALPWRQPHQHDAGPWGPLDYGRDFLGWLNPFRGLPGRQAVCGD